MKKAIATLGVLGLVGCFLPLFATVSLFDFRHGNAVDVYLILAAFAAAALAGLADETRVAAVVGTLGFGYVIYKFGFDTLDLVFEGAIGAKLIGVATVAGFACSLAAFTERDHRRA